MIRIIINNIKSTPQHKEPVSDSFEVLGFAELPEPMEEPSELAEAPEPMEEPSELAEAPEPIGELPSLKLLEKSEIANLFPQFPQNVAISLFS